MGAYPLHKASAERPKFRRLRQINGDTEDLAWLQLEKRTNQRIPDELFRWLKKERISAKDILFIADRMSPIQIRNYLQKQKPYFDGSCRQASCPCSLLEAPGFQPHTG